MSHLDSAPHVPRLTVPQLPEQVRFWQQVFGRVTQKVKPPQIRKEHYEVPLLLLPKRSTWRTLLELPATTLDGGIIERVCDQASPLPDPWKPLCYLESPTTWYRLKQGVAKTVKELEDAFPEDLFILVQAGDDFHLGKSPIHTCATLRFAEFALDLLSGMAMSMVCLGLKRHSQQHFHLYCPGGEYDQKGGSKWSDTPRIDIEFGRVAFDWNGETRARDGYHNLTAVRFR